MGCNLMALAFSPTHCASCLPATRSVFEEGSRINAIVLSLCLSGRLQVSREAILSDCTGLAVRP
jgi:hypothetical protein